MKTTTNKKGFVVRGSVNSNLILCDDGEFHAATQVGPGGWNAKIYKTESGARRAYPTNPVEAVTA